MAAQNIYLVGEAAHGTLPLERFLPPVPRGVVSAWLKGNSEAGSWVLDPFGSAPQVAIEAAQAGYRVAVAANNPIVRFLLEMQSQPPSSETLQAALAELAASRRGEQRLEPHILELYATRCPACGQMISARAFIWTKEAEGPEGKLIECERCGHKGEHPTDREDVERAASFRRGGPHQARALERIAPRGDPDRRHVEEALEAYLPRAVYALFTILNRLDGLTIPDETRELLSALLLHALDRTNVLWSHPGGRARPKQLSAPPTFREHNIWRELEDGIDLWASQEGRAPLVEWPRVPPESGGISLFEGRLREMAPSLNEVPVAAVVSALPRPNQAYWTLSALWAGWLWGREAIGPFASVLRRRRYDWAWHTEALAASLNQLAKPLAGETPFLGVIAESEPGFNAAALIAANLAAFQVQGLALRREEGQLQVHWNKAESGIPVKETEVDASEAARAASQALLEKRGEPCDFVHLHAAALMELAQHPGMAATQSEPGEIYSETRASLEVGLTYRGGFLRFGGHEKSLQAGQWWLADSSGARKPLADRLEMAVVRYLLRYPGRSLHEIDQAMCAVFSGLLTPSRQLLLATLNSYAGETDGKWQMRAADLPKARRENLREMRGLLAEMGERLGFSVDSEGVVRWVQGKEAAYTFHVIASGLLGELLPAPGKLEGQQIILLPGGRAHLVLAKLGRDARLRQAMDEGWSFLKFRHLRRLAENQSLTAESFEELRELDPLTEDPAQAPLL